MDDRKIPTKKGYFYFFLAIMSVEPVYDSDDEAKELCDKLGISMFRASTVGTDPRFVTMIRQLVEELLFHDAAIVVHDQTEMQNFVRRSYRDREWSSDLGDRAKKVVLTHVGASQRTVDCLSEILTSLPSSASSLGNHRAA